MDQASGAHRPILRRAGYGAALFVAAAGSLVLEIVGARLLAPYVGVSLYTWTSIIAVVLTGLSIGHWIGGHVAERDVRACRRALVWAFLLAALTAVGSLVLLRVLSGPVLSAGLGPVTSIVVLSAALFLLPVLFAGIVSPVLTRLALDEAPRSRGRVLGQMYALGALGSIGGTLAAGFLFISWIGSTGTVMTVAGCYALTAGLFVLASGAPTRRGLLAGVAAAALAVAIAVGGASVRAFQSPCLTESDYYCIRVVDFTFEAGRPSALLVLDHLGHGINDRDDPALLFSSYVELTDRLFQERLGRTGGFEAYFIGGGAYTLPRAWMAAHPEASLLVAEIDPAVTQVAREHLWLAPAGKVRVLHQDGRTALQELPAEPLFDAVLGDAFHDITVPPHLVTVEFAREIARRLRPAGTYALNVVDAVRAPRFLFAVVKTLRPVFAAVEVWADADQLAAGGRTTFVVAAGDRATPVGRLASPRDETRLWLRWPGEDLAARIAASGVPVLSDDYAPVDRLLRNGSYRDRSGWSRASCWRRRAPWPGPAT
jgi:predicted membrane-bound spermidine synthase